MNINEVLLLGLNEPQYSRIEFWQIHQKQSGYSEFVFWRKLVDSWKYYRGRIDTDIARHRSWGNQISDIRLPLLLETNFCITGHFGNYELDILNESLIEYGEKLKEKYEPASEDYKPVEIAFDYAKAVLSLTNSENKFWKGLPMYKVIEHFQVMTKRENKKGTPFLTEKQLVSFLKRGFLGDDSEPKQTVNCASGEKGFVIKRFYEFFDLAVSQYHFPQRKREFIDLFSHCFDNWDESTVKSYFRPDKAKEKW